MEVPLCIDAELLRGGVGPAHAGSCCGPITRPSPPADDAGTPFDAVDGAQSGAPDWPRSRSSRPIPDLPDGVEGSRLTSTTARSGSIRTRRCGKGRAPKFTAEFFHRGYLYKDRVDIFEVVNGRALPVPYSPDLFTFGQLTPPERAAISGFAGFRLQYPLNRADYDDEVCAFLGASYFRAVAKGQGYGLSARGLAIKTADAGRRGIPVFKDVLAGAPAARQRFDGGARAAGQPERRRPRSASRCARARTPSWIPRWRCIRARTSTRPAWRR